MIPDTRAIIVYWMMISSFAILVLFWWRPPDPTNQLLNTLIGIYVSTGFITALQWWMGIIEGIGRQECSFDRRRHEEWRNTGTPSHIDERIHAMRAIIVVASLFLCGSAHAQVKMAQADRNVQIQRPSMETSRPSDCHLIDIRLACHLEAGATSAKTLGPCLSLFNSVNPETFIGQLEACKDSDIQAVLENANKEPKDNVAIDCWQPIQDIVKSATAGNGGILLAFQLFRRAKMQGVIGKCTAYVTTTIMLQ